MSDSAGYCPRCGGDAQNPVADCPTCNGFAACSYCGHPKAAHPAKLNGTQYPGSPCWATIHNKVESFSYPCPCRKFEEAS